MPEVTFNPELLPDDSPLFKSGKRKLRKRVKRLLKQRILPSRGVPKLGENGYGRTAFVLDENPIRNTELFNSVADEIEFFPESYDQGRWGFVVDQTSEAETLCGTAFCIAGHGVHRTGWVPFRGINDWYELWLPEVIEARSAITVNIAAAHEYGLTSKEQSLLFNERWLPAIGMTVPEALRALGSGADLFAVTDEQFLNGELDEYGQDVLRQEYALRGEIQTTQSQTP